VRATVLLVGALALMSLWLTACWAPTPTPTPTPPPSAVVEGGPTPIPTMPPLPRPPPEAPEEFRSLWEAYQILRREYVDSGRLDPARLVEGAIKGMLETLEDPYTSYLTPEAYEIQSTDLSGQFEGIGATVELRNGRLILNPLPGSPAERAGIRPGDTVLAVDGQSTEGWSLLEAVVRIRGPKGTVVRLTVKHVGEPEPEVVEVVRDVIRLQSVYYNRMREGFAYIRLTTFYQDTDEALTEVLRQALQEGVQGIVLDLRNNPGGLLESAVRVASLFLKRGLVLYEVDGQGRRRDWPVQRMPVGTDLPMVVLVNGFTASGAEVVAGALQDHGRAVLVGERTLGKGAVNLLRPLSNGGALYFSYAYWYTPKGRLIQFHGLEPDILVRQPPDVQGDPQLEQAVAVLKERIGR